MVNQANWILQRTVLSSEDIALIDVHQSRKWTYKQLRTEIQKWLGFFSNQAYEKGDTIAVCARNNIQLFPLMFACSLAGLIYVPLNWRLSVKELQYLLEDCKAETVIYDEFMEEIVTQLDLKSRFPLSVQETYEKLPLDNLIPTLEEEAWMIIYTGGTTGKPKGVVLSHRSITVNAINTILSWEITKEDTTVNYMPLFHTGGINALCIPILMAGGTVIVGNVFDAEEALMVTDQYEATISLFVPTMYQEIVGSSYFKKSNFPSMKIFISGGAPCPKNIYKAFKKKNLKFREGYGLTEAGPNNFVIDPDLAQKKIGSVGKSMLLNEVRIINEVNHLCEANEVGELYLRGGHLFVKYWNNVEETKEVFTNGWFKTGDLAKYDQDGDYYIVGRMKDMIITGGENVYPQEVEQSILQYRHVKEVAVIGVPDDKWGEKVVAFISVIEEGEFQEADLREFLKEHLGAYKIPKAFYLVDQIPKTDVGKIDKNVLLERLTRKG